MEFIQNEYNKSHFQKQNLLMPTTEAEADLLKDIKCIFFLFLAEK